MPIRIAEPKDANDYTKIPFQFAQELTATNVFLQLPDGFSPLERMVLQTTGNLQRLLSAYYNVPSRVVVLKNELIPCEDQDEDGNNEGSQGNTANDITIATTLSPLSASASSLSHKEQVDNSNSSSSDSCTLHQDVGHIELDMLFERKILMYFGDKLAYEADSLVSVKDQETLSLLSKHEYGLGQIFSHLRRTPSFALRVVGRHGTEYGQSFWRDYSLSAPGVVDCYIRETFVEGLFEPYAGSKDSAGRGTVWYNPEQQHL
ncbi:hypothetical protein BDB00DRAFT_783833 [Zychaea mexicana]|uniref:uncharacterized protein n=1 Tax=Zychaea mexicana TaxID=64656 RepID=UPI0022FE224E|nr:uncharacterized protein BDB00DRAFT_783833 [Zychaea mexicana]KAI9498723.1 hypothetical protein BDB00DRAFT_783833 [Zychaea mexicana]